MSMKTIKQIFSDAVVQGLFPPERSNDFFEALFGDAEEGAYDVTLSFDDYDAGERSLRFFLNLHERPGKCLACNLTYGLPEVFSRHPVINIKGLVQDIEKLPGLGLRCVSWRLGNTVQKGRSLHCIPLEIEVQEAQ